MIEKTVLDYLTVAIPDAVVRMEVPAIPAEMPAFPERLVIIEKVGSTLVNHIHTDSIAIQSYSPESLFKAASLDEEVRDAMDVMAEQTDAISACRMASNYNFTDTSTKRYRYQCVYDITY